MNISAISCSPIRPKASFGIEEDTKKYDSLVKATSEMNDQLVNSSTIKKPVAALASIGLAGAVAFVSGKRIAGIVSHVSKNAPVALENGLKKGAILMKNTAKRLQSANPDKQILSEGSKFAEKKLGKLINKVKIGKVENIVGTAIGKAEDVARKAYTKVAYAGLEEGGNKAAKAMENLFGWGAVGTIVPTVLKRDSNEDGVSDILERGQNTYTGTQTKFAGAIDKANSIADIVDLLT